MKFHLATYFVTKLSQKSVCMVCYLRVVVVMILCVSVQINPLTLVRVVLLVILYEQLLSSGLKVRLNMKGFFNSV